MATPARLTPAVHLCQTISWWNSQPGGRQARHQVEGHRVMAAIQQHRADHHGAEAARPRDAHNCAEYALQPVQVVGIAGVAAAVGACTIVLRAVGGVEVVVDGVPSARNHLTVGWTWGAGRVPGEAGVRVMVTRVQLDKLGARIEELAALRRVHRRNTPVINGGLCQGMME